LLVVNAIGSSPKFEYGHLKNETKYEKRYVQIREKDQYGKSNVIVRWVYQSVGIVLQ